MSGKPDQAELTDGMSESQVLTYLRQNPEFLQSHTDLLESLKLPHRQFGHNVHDWQAFVIERLQDENVTLRAREDEMVAKLRGERSWESQLFSATLAMMATTSLRQLVDTATTDLSILLGPDVVRMAVETNCADRDARNSGVRCLRTGAVDTLMDDGNDVVIRTPAHAHKCLFGSASPLVQYEVLARFGGTGGLPPGLLAMGWRNDVSEKPTGRVHHYRFLAKVLDHCLRNRLGLCTN